MEPVSPSGTYSSRRIRGRAKHRPRRHRPLPAPRQRLDRRRPRIRAQRHRDHRRPHRQRRLRIPRHRPDCGGHLQPRLGPRPDTEFFFGEDFLVTSSAVTGAAPSGRDLCTLANVVTYAPAYSIGQNDAIDAKLQQLITAQSEFIMSEFSREIVGLSGPRERPGANPSESFACASEAVRTHGQSARTSSRRAASCSALRGVQRERSPLRTGGRDAKSPRQSASHEHRRDPAGAQGDDASRETVEPVARPSRAQTGLRSLARAASRNRCA